MSEQSDQLNAIVEKWSKWAFAAGFIPYPLADFAAVAAIQLKMIRELACECEVEMSDHQGKSFIGSFVGAGVPTSLGSGTIKRMIGYVPVAGKFAKMLTMPAFAAASTFATGKVFVQHFASGGTFLSFDPDSVRDYYEQQFESKRAELAKEEPAAKTSSSKSAKATAT
ncbi:MAG: YcjF family protein [Holophagales bacterium]|nr:YcjF family protein [Holophagales bacterium]